jgi:hypothetical protein
MPHPSAVDSTKICKGRKCNNEIKCSHAQTDQIRKWKRSFVFWPRKCKGQFVRQIHMNDMWSSLTLQVFQVSTPVLVSLLWNNTETSQQQHSKTYSWSNSIYLNSMCKTTTHLFKIYFVKQAGVSTAITCKDWLQNEVTLIFFFVFELFCRHFKSRYVMSQIAKYPICQIPQNFLQRVEGLLIEANLNLINFFSRTF